MKKGNQIEKTCENCSHYLRHYTKRETRLIKVFCGHCLIKSNTSKILPYAACQKWEGTVINKDEIKKAVKTILENMSHRLDEIAMILKDDTE